MNTQLWKHPVKIEPNGFKHKSLSMWSCNVAVGCGHGCRFCYVPTVSTVRMAGQLKPLGVMDADADWGQYVFPRPLDEKVFLDSLAKAERAKPAELNADGNRAVMLCTTTDPYQVVARGGEKGQAALRLPTRRVLELMLEYSTINVRILTRSPLARQDFDLMRRFGDRLMFGMSLPTLDGELSAIYEPKAPHPARRLETLQLAREAGLHVFVAVAPVYPDCDAADMRRTLDAVAALQPLTVFMEPLNIRGENVRRIEEGARSQRSGARKLRTEVFANRQAWKRYAIEQLYQFEYLARQAGIGDDVLHLWPDAALGGAPSPQSQVEERHQAWLEKHWAKVSAWPSRAAAKAITYWVPAAGAGAETSNFKLQ